MGKYYSEGICNKEKIEPSEVMLNYTKTKPAEFLNFEFYAVFFRTLQYSKTDRGKQVFFKYICVIPDSCITIFGFGF